MIILTDDPFWMFNGNFGSWIYTFRIEPKEEFQTVFMGFITQNFHPVWEFLWVWEPVAASF